MERKRGRRLISSREQDRNDRDKFATRFLTKVLIPGIQKRAITDSIYIAPAFEDFRKQNISFGNQCGLPVIWLTAWHLHSQLTREIVERPQEDIDTWARAIRMLDKIVLGQSAPDSH